MIAAEYAEALAALTLATADRVRELVEAGDLDGALRASLDGSAAVEKLSADYHRSRRARIPANWRTQRIALPVSPDAAPVEVPVVADVNSSGEPVWTGRVDGAPPAAKRRRPIKYEWGSVGEAVELGPPDLVPMEWEVTSDRSARTDEGRVSVRLYLLDPPKPTDYDVSISTDGNTWEASVVGVEGSSATASSMEEAVELAVGCAYGVLMARRELARVKSEDR